MLTMGTSDGFHAALNPGIEFVWLNSTATLAGGIFMSMVWLPERFVQIRVSKWLPRHSVTEKYAEFLDSSKWMIYNY